MKNIHSFVIEIPITIKTKNVFEAMELAEETKRYVMEKTGMTGKIKKCVKLARQSQNE